MTEVRTDSGYVMLKQGIDVVISQKNTDASCDIYGADVLGLIQNDPRYAEIIKDTGDLKNMPQKHLEHKLLTASATAMIDILCFTEYVPPEKGPGGFPPIWNTSC